MLYSYVYLHTTLHREYFLILRFEFSKFSRLKSWLYYYRTHARSKWEILQPSLDLTIAKKRLRKMQLGIILISQGGRIVFFDECSMYIYVEEFFFLVEFVYFYELKNPWSKKEVEKKNCARKFLQQMFSEILFLRLLIYFQGHLFDQKSSISTFNRFITWHVCCLFSSKKMYAS